MLYRIALNFFHNTHIAEEITQDVFLKLHENLHLMESEAHAASWLRRAATHRCIDLMRKRSHLNEETREALPDVGSELEDDDPLLREHLRRLIAALPEAQRAVVVLRYGEDLNSEEIGEMLGMPAATVRSHLQRALATLRQLAPRALGRVFDGSV